MSCGTLRACLHMGLSWKSQCALSAPPALIPINVPVDNPETQGGSVESGRHLLGPVYIGGGQILRAAQSPVFSLLGWEPDWV